jgi:hypothetical protein
VEGILPLKTIIKCFVLISVIPHIITWIMKLKERKINMDNPYIVTKQDHVKIHSWGNDSNGVSFYESDYPEGITLYYVGTDSDKFWRRFLTEYEALEDCKWLNKRHNRILELSNGKVYV